MTDEQKIPLLIQYLFGKQADKAWRSASPRLRLWARAFDDWLASRRTTKDTCYQSQLAWKRLLEERGKLPWELQPADIRQHLAWMEAQCYAPRTMANSVGFFSRFYEWCEAHQVDPERPPGFNPTLGVPRPRYRRHIFADGKSVLLWTREEVRRLLSLVSADDSPLGCRDYALFLARLWLGAPPVRFQKLVWGQIEHSDGKAWVRWRPDAQPCPLPDQVWQAILRWLEISGRLDGMQPESYLFVPLNRPNGPQVGKKKEDWKEGRCLATRMLVHSLKVYGRAAGISEEKLTAISLWRTAIRLWLDREGEDGDHAWRERFKAFLDSWETGKMSWMSLRNLLRTGDGGAQPPAGDGEPSAASLAPVEGQPEDLPELKGRLPHRWSRTYQLWGNLKYGLHARNTPEEVQAILAEDVHGLDDELAGLGELKNRLLELQAEPSNRPYLARILDLVTQVTHRALEMGKTKAILGQDGQMDALDEQILAVVRSVNEERRRELDEADGTEGGAAEMLEGEQGAALLGHPEIAVQIASVRFALRRSFYLAMTGTDTDEVLRMITVYHKSCYPLMHMLKDQAASQSSVTEKWRLAVDQAITEFTEEFGLGNYG